MGLYSWLEKKEGGFWGVVVIFAAFMIQIPSFGTAQSFGIYNMYLLRYFKDVSPAAVALIGSINVGVFLGSGPIATFLMNHMSHRKVALLGAVLSSAGLIAMPFAPNLVYMYGFYGVLSGLGFCLVYVPSHVLSGLYYDEKRSLATGLATSGSGMGAIIFPLLVNFLVDTFGWRGSFYIVCGISMQNIVFASLLRPVPEKLKERYKEAAERRETDPGDKEDTVTDAVKSKQQTSTSTLQLLSVKSLAEKEKGDNEQLLSEDSRAPLSENDIDLSLHEKLKQGSDQQSLKQESNFDSTKEDTNLENSKGDANLKTKNLDSTLENSEDSNLETQQHDPNLENSRQGSDMQNSQIKQETEEAIMASPVGSPAKLIKQESSENEEDALYKNNDLPRNSLNEVEKLALGKKSTCSILCDYAFIIFFANNIFWNMGIVIILLFGPQYLLYVGLDEQSSALVFSIGGIGAFVGSILGGLLGNIKNLRLDLAYIVITVITGIICLIMPVPVFHSFGGLVFLFVTFSVMANMISGLLVVAVAAIVGADAIGTGMGYIMLANGIGSIVAPPLIGWVYEVTGSPDVAFYIGGSFIILAGLLIILIPLIDHFYTEETKTTGKKPDKIQKECLNVYCM